MKLILVFITLFISGCASLGPKFTEVKSYNKKNALVYIYRPSRFASSAVNPYLCLDKKVIGETANNSYLPIEVKPGKRNLYLKNLGDQLGSIDFRVRAGSTYYLRVDMPLLTSSDKSNPGINHGAIGAAIGHTLMPDSKEATEIEAKRDKRFPNKNINIGLMFVNAKHAKKEIVKTKIFNIPEYKRNFCIKKKKKKEKPAKKSKQNFS